MPGLVLALVLATVVGACQDNETAIARGDRLWADSAYPAALAEYRLAVAQRGDVQAHLRLAHAYASTGDLAEARTQFGEILARDPALADQAVFDFLRIARSALRRGDRLTAAAALDAALSLRPELNAGDMALPIARFHRERGDAERAAAYYVRALSAMAPDTAPRALYEIGLVHEQAGRCDLAVDYFRAFRAQADPRSGRWGTALGEARWHLGRCGFRLAQEARERGAVQEALDHLEQMIRLGEPENLLDQAWFDRGELLHSVGRYDDALAAYRRVVERSPTRTGQLVQRAQMRIDEIRFGTPTTDTVP